MSASGKNNKRNSSVTSTTAGSSGGGQEAAAEDLFSQLLEEVFGGSLEAVDLAWQDFKSKRQLKKKEKEISSQSLPKKKSRMVTELEDCNKVGKQEAVVLTTSTDYTDNSGRRRSTRIIRNKDEKEESPTTKVNDDITATAAPIKGDDKKKKSQQQGRKRKKGKAGTAKDLASSSFVTTSTTSKEKQQQEEKSTAATSTITTTNNNKSSSSSSSSKVFVIPEEALKDRCIRAYGWKEDFAIRALVGYRQFMTLKVQQKDWVATVLSPSIIVDQVWHQHILDVHNYVKACQDYTTSPGGCGHLIGHNPDGGLDLDARALRIQTTKKCLQNLYGDGDDRIDWEIWSFGGGEGGNNNNNNNNKENVSQNDNDNNNDSSSPKNKKRRVGEESTAIATTSTISQEGPDNNNEKITLTVQGARKSEDMRFIIKRNQPIGRIFKSFAEKKGVMVDDLRFVLSGGRGTIHPAPSQTPNQLGLNHNDIIYVHIKWKIPSYHDVDDDDDDDDNDDNNNDIKIIMGVRNTIESGTTWFRLGCNTRMVKLYNLYTELKGVRANDARWRFVFDGEWIENSQTPRMIGLSDQFVIHAMLQCRGC